MDISVLGDKRLQKVMNGLEPKVAKKHMRRAMRESFRPVLKAAQARAASFTNPANKTDLMLRVSRGLKLRAIKARRGAFGVRVVTPPRDKLGLPGWSKDGAGRFYPPAYVERGTKRTPALSYLRAPLHENRDRVMRSVRVRLWRAIRKEARA